MACPFFCGCCCAYFCVPLIIIGMVLLAISFIIALWLIFKFVVLLDERLSDDGGVVTLVTDGTTPMSEAPETEGTTTTTPPPTTTEKETCFENPYVCNMVVWYDWFIDQCKQKKGTLKLSAKNCQNWYGSSSRELQTCCTKAPKPPSRSVTAGIDLEASYAYQTASYFIAMFATVFTVAVLTTAFVFILTKNYEKFVLMVKVAVVATGFHCVSTGLLLVNGLIIPDNSEGYDGFVQVAAVSVVLSFIFVGQLASCIVVLCRWKRNKDYNDPGLKWILETVREVKNNIYRRKTRKPNYDGDAGATADGQENDKTA